MDKVQKIREEVERLKRWNDNVRESTRHMTLQEEDFNRGKHSSYLEILNFIDSLQEEPAKPSVDEAMAEIERKAKLFTEVNKGKTSEEILAEMRGEEPVSIWHEASKKYPLTGKEIIVLRDDKIYYGKYIGGFHRYVRAEIQLTDDTAQTYAIIDNLTKKDKWIYVEDLLNLSNVERTVKYWKEPVSEDLGEYINKLSKQFPEVSFAKLSRVAVRVAKWKERQLMANAVEGVVHHFEKCKVASVHYNDPTGVPMAYFTSPEGLSAGDKVKIIVIKEG